MKFLGLIKREEMNDIYNLADVMFLPSYEELFPMAILESMNSYTPILLRDLPIYDNILFDFYSKAKTNDGFVDILHKMKQDKEFYQSCCDGSKKGHDFYSREHVSAMWREFYLMVANKSIIR